MQENEIEKADQFNKTIMEKVPIEEKEDTKLRISLFSFFQILFVDFLYFILLILFSLFTFLFSAHYSTGQRRYYFTISSNPNFYFYEFQVQPYSSYVKLYFRIGEKKKKEHKTQLSMGFDVQRIFNNNNNHTHVIAHRSRLTETIQYDGKMFHSTPITLYSSHDTSNSSINFQVQMRINDINIDGVTIYWEFGTTSQYFFFMFCKSLYLIISFVILLLLIWVIYETDKYLWVTNFTISVVFWGIFNLYLLVYSNQFSNYLYVFISFLLRAAYTSIEKFVFIILISSIRLDRIGSCFENIFASAGIYLFAFLGLVSSFLYSLSMIKHDQIGFESHALLMDFFINIVFLFYIIVQYGQTKWLINTTENTHLFAFFSLSVIHFCGKIVVLFFTVITNYYMCRQAGNTIDMTNSFFLSMFLFVFNWPIDEENIFDYTNQNEIPMVNSLELDSSE